MVFLRRRPTKVDLLCRSIASKVRRATVEVNAKEREVPFYSFVTLALLADVKLRECRIWRLIRFDYTATYEG